MDKKVVIVRLNKGKGQVAFVAGREENKNSDDNREFRCGLSVFFRKTIEEDFNYILSFVLSDDEVEMLSSPAKVKTVEDLNFILLANNWNLRIIKNYMCYTRDKSDLVKKINVEYPAGYTSMSVISEVSFISDNKYDFINAIELAMNNPFTSSNLYRSMPEHTEEEEVVL